MLSQLEQACKTYSTEFSFGLIEFDSDWQRIFVTALTFHLDQAIHRSRKVKNIGGPRVRILGGQGGPNSQQANDVVTTSMRRNDVASTSFRRHSPRLAF